MFLCFHGWPGRLPDYSAAPKGPHDRLSRPALVKRGRKGERRMQRRTGDRRCKPRFEIVGDLWGTVDMTAPLPVHNLGRGGALLESSIPLPTDSVHWLSAVADGEPCLLQVRVRHSTSTGSSPDEPRYLIGVEFVQLSPAVEEIIARYTALGNGPVAVEA